MKSIVKTAGSFDKVLGSCKSIGERYQPKAPSLSITAMSELQERSQQTTQAVIVTRAAYRLAINNRRESFAGIPKLSVRIVRMLASSEESRENLSDAISLKDSLQTATRSRKSASAVKSEEAPAPARRAPARRNYDTRIESFANLIKIVEDMGSYDPNEADLTLEALKAKLADLRSKSHEVNMALINFDKARNERKQVIYGPHGVTETIKAVKDYIRGAFGQGSSELEQIMKAS
jgi:hypothetical protein